MSATSHAVQDSATMLRRNLVHAIRYPGNSLATAAMPILMLLLFVGVFGNTMGAGIGDDEYVDYVAPAIILMAATSGSVSTAVSVSIDMTEGIINRFRTMAIARSSVLTGHVLGSLIQTLVSIVLVVGVAVLMGFRPTANVVDWLGALGLLAFITFALTWLAAAAGMVARSVETASNLPLPIMLLPMMGSGFVPTDSMPTVVRWFAEYQPFTPIIETLRGLLMGTPIDGNGVVALAWCAALSVVGFLCARAAFNRVPTS